MADYLIIVNCGLCTLLRDGALLQDSIPYKEAEAIVLGKGKSDDTFTLLQATPNILHKASIGDIRSGKA